MSSSVQVTPANAPELLALLRRMAAGGTVYVAAQGLVGGSNWSGPMTFRMGNIDGIQVIEGHGGRRGGVVMPIPVMPAGHLPRREGEAVAHYSVAGNVVLITYTMPHGTGWRRFQFTL